MASKPRFDYDLNGDEYCAVGGEMVSRQVMDGLDSWLPTEGTDKPSRTCKVLGSLDCSEFHTAREGTRGK